MAPYARKVVGPATASHGLNVAPIRQTDPPVASHGNTSFVSCLTAAIDGSLLGRKAVAADAGLNDQALSKILAGTWGIPTALVDSLDDDTFLDLMKRLGRGRGIEVRMLEPQEINEQLLEAASRLTRLVGLASSRRRCTHSGKR
jgi:hypothetical protein